MATGTALITGASGFVGPHVAAEMARSGWTVWTLDRSTQRHNAMRSVRADLGERDHVRRAVEDAQPDVVIHLAAQSSVPLSFKDPAATLSNNLLGAANLFYAVADLVPAPRVLSVGSAEEYGAVRPEHLPIHEEQPLAPVSPYGVSKAAQSLLALSLHTSHGLPVTVLRPFNHTGPGQRPDFVVSAFARQVARIEAGLDPPVIRTGNLDARRDFTDVRDVARAYRLAATQAVAGEVYNIGSGRSVPVRWILEELLRLSAVPATVETDPERLTPSTVPELCANPEKFRRATGWAPQISLEQTIRDVLTYWREQTEGEKQRA